MKAWEVANITIKVETIWRICILLYETLLKQKRSDAIELHTWHFVNYVKYFN